MGIVGGESDARDFLRKTNAHLDEGKKGGWENYR